MATRTVSVALVADIGQFQSAMAKAAATTKTVGAEAETSSSKARRGFELAGRGATLLGGVLAGGVALGLKSVIGAASDLNETLNKSNVIFGQNSGQIEKWANGAAKNVGLSKQAALEAAASFGNMFQQLGFAGDQASGMSTNVVQLAADLGSFNNLETGDVLERIAAGFRGEYDSLQLLVPNINAARVESEALAMTGKENAKQLTAQEKAAAVLAIVQKDGAAAANDFAETSDGLANSAKIAAAEFEDLKTKVGQEFLPAAQGAMHFLSDTAIPVIGGTVDVVSGLAGAFGDLPGPVQTGILTLAGVAALKGPVSSAFDTIALRAMYARDAFAGASLTMGGLKAAGSGLMGFFGGPWGLAITGVTVGLSMLVGWLGKGSDTSSEMASAQGDLRDAIAATNGVIDDSVRRTAAKILQDKHLLDFTELYGVSSRDMVGYVLGEADAHDRVSTSLERYRDRLESKLTGDAEADMITRGLIGAVDQHIASLDGLATGTDTTIGKERQLAEATSATGGAMEGSAAQTEEATKALEKWLGQLQQIGEGFVDPLSTYKGLLDEKTQAERDAAEKTAAATQSSKDSWQDYVDDVGVSLDEYAAKLEEQIQNQENWRANLVTVSGRGGVEVAQILAQMGQDGVQIVAQMATSSDAEFQRMAAALIRDAQLGGQGATTELDTAMKIMAAVGSDGAARTAAGVAYQLGIGVDQVRAIAQQYGIQLADGVNPLLAALGQRTVAILNRGNSRSGPQSGGTSGPGFADGGYTGNGAKHEPKGVVHGGEFVFTKEQTDKAGVGNLYAYAKALDGYANGGFVAAADVPRPASTAPYGPPISTAGDAAMDTAYRATADFVRENGPFGRALAWARSQVGKPYIWGGVGPAGYDCSGFMSAITNAVLGRSPYSRVGSTANFPWPGFAPGNTGVFNIGSTPNSGDGIGHMAGTLLGVNVESRGGQGVVVGGSARGASNGLFSTRAHLAMFNGGVIGEPVVGVGTRSGNSYSFAERGPEVVLPTGREVSGGSGRPGGVPSVNVGDTVVKVYIDGQEFRGIARVEAEAAVGGVGVGVAQTARYGVKRP